MQELLLHPTTKRQLEHFLNDPSHALMLVGPLGSGKRMLANQIGKHLLKLGSDSTLTAHPYFMYISAASGREISIDQIRVAISKLKLKVPGKSSVKRVILIEDAQLMSLEAQTALLKSLEEPAGDTAFILTVPSEKAVLPTVASRVAKLRVYPVSLTQAKKFFMPAHPEKTIESSWVLSQGAVGLLHALLKEDTHALKMTIGETKKWLKLSRYERLLALEPISKERQSLGFFLEALSKVLGALHYQAIQTKSPKVAQRLLADRRLVQKLQLAAEANVSVRLISLKLLVNIKV